MKYSILLLAAAAAIIDALPHADVQGAIEASLETRQQVVHHRPHVQVMQYQLTNILPVLPDHGSTMRSVRSVLRRSHLSYFTDITDGPEMHISIPQVVDRSLQN